LLGVALPDGARVVVGDDHNVGGHAELLPPDASHGDEVARRVRHDARATRHLVDRCGGGEALGDVDRPRVVEDADRPEATADGPAWMVTLLALVRDVLERAELTIHRVDGRKQPPVGSDAESVRANAFTG
jgi:hypothetical protein